MDKAKGAADVQGTMSERQNKKIEESYKKDFDRVANSESFRAMSHDARLFGRDAFKKGG
jgi:dGTP triphosphohydrolase